MSVVSSTMSFVIQPISDVHIAVRMYESTLSVGHIVLPPTLVFRSIRPDLFSSSVPQSIFRPLTLINCSIVKLERSSCDQLNIFWIVLAVILKWAKSFFSSFCVFIPVVWHDIDFFSWRMNKSSLFVIFLFELLENSSNSFASPIRLCFDDFL